MAASVALAPPPPRLRRSTRVPDTAVPTTPRESTAPAWRGERLQRANRVGLRPLRALAGLEGDALVLLQAPEAVGLDGGVVDEDVRPVVVRGDEAVTLLGVE